MIVISQSRIKCWRECKRRYWYRHVRKLQRKRRPRPLLRGTIIHQMIEAHIQKLDPWKVYRSWMKKYGKVFQEEIELYGDLAAEIKLLMEGYFAFYRRDPMRYLRRKGRKAEFPFELEIASGIVLKGKIDAIGQTRDRRKWLIDTKSHKTLPTSEFKFTDIQSMTYTWVMPRVGLPEPDGVCWDYVRAKTPSTPLLLKDGSMSRKNIDTTWTVYRHALMDAGLKPTDYKDMREHLQGKEEDFYRRVYLPISKTVQDTVVDEMITTAKEIGRRAGKDTTRTIAKHCEWCEFSDLCRAELTGIDHRHILKVNFEESDYEKDEDKSSNE